jgi:hypothetical protein
MLSPNRHGEGKALILRGAEKRGYNSLILKGVFCQGWLCLKTPVIPALFGQDWDFLGRVEFACIAYDFTPISGSGVRQCY